MWWKDWYIWIGSSIMGNVNDLNFIINRIHNCRFFEGTNLEDVYRLNEEYEFCIEYTQNIENPILRYLVERML